MNAKKIMGAVLVAFLAAALFIGAGAAAVEDVDGTIVFVNEKVNKTNYSVSWTGPNGAYTPAVDAADPESVYFQAAGVYTYKKGDNTTTVTVKVPELTISGVANKDNAAIAYPFIPGTLYQNTNVVNVTVANVSSANIPYDLYITYPDGDEEKVTVDANGNVTNVVLTGTPAVGEYSFRAEFNASYFTVGTTLDQRVTVPVTFSVVKGGEATISAAADTVLKSESIKLTITGQPGVRYNVTYEDYAFSVAKDQFGFTFNNLTADQKEGIYFTMPNGGKVEFAVKANATTKSSEKIVVKADEVTGAKQASVVINFEKGTISAKTEFASYFVGDSVKVIVTSTAGMPTKFNINGTNFGYTSTTFSQSKEEGNTLEFYLDTGLYVSTGLNSIGKKMDVGTYTVTLIVSDDVKATVPLTLKQPFISIAEAPEVIVQGEDDVEFIINAEACQNGIGYYIFGTNYFATDDYVTLHPTDEDGEDIKTQFVVELSSEETQKMAPGQYFAVFQHPMYDGYLNITGDETNWTIKQGSTVIIDVNERQTANAAQALCDALDVQTIDDMYVKYSFFVVGEDESFTISEIPTSVAQGETITISGVSTANADNTVTVEMISTAFAAVPKETVGSAAFILVTTTVAEDGTWEVTLDTSDLNVDEYSLNVACEGTTWKNVKVNVVEGADTPDTPDTPDVPDTPDTPDTPTEPTTPGFGALAALAGLGAVAVLLLRRE